jgi:hypothetical protein
VTRASRGHRRAYMCAFTREEKIKRARVACVRVCRGPRGGAEQAGGQGRPGLRGLQPGHWHRHHRTGDGAREPSCLPACLLPAARRLLAQRPAARRLLSLLSLQLPLAAARPPTPPTRPPALLQAFEAASGLKVNVNLTDRRPGDAEAVWAATETAEKELG